MRTIAVMNQKGGVGKTTTSVNLSSALAAMGKKVLLIDLDPQAHASLHLGLTFEKEFPSVYDVLVCNQSLDSVRRQVSDNLWLVPAHLDLASADFELASVVGRELILRDKIAADTMEFDYIVVDCPPSLGVLTLNALAAVEEVFIPLQPHFLALHGLSKLLQTIDLVSRRLNPQLYVSGVVLCMFERTTLSTDVRADVEAFFSEHEGRPKSWSSVKVFETNIRKNVRLAEAPSYGQSILEYDPKSNGAEDYLAFAEEVARM
ncbi:MAG: ParA family protein [Thermoguttaceae bacterium]|jgi:chromosome partitioning protein|nr:ParA family protein [Thermoguttaceae bacterium]MBR4752254.1 ParA family protein [Thermoguttaceae bacterium]MBR5759770.1 ParA family protein [Thermoguttaceae bacterium]